MLLIQQICALINITAIIFYKIFSPCMKHSEFFVFFFLEFREYMSFAISSSTNTWGIKLGIAEVLFLSVSIKKNFLGYSALGVLSFSIWLCDPWLLIEISLNLEKAESTKSLVQLDQLNQQVQSLFCSCWQHPRLLVLAVCFDTMLDNCYSQIYL